MNNTVREYLATAGHLICLEKTERLLKKYLRCIAPVAIVMFCSLSQLHAQTDPTPASSGSPTSSGAALKGQCTETAKTTGVRCKIKVEEGKLFCKIHDPSTPRCGKPTGKDKLGPACRNTVKVPGTGCSHHPQ